MNTDQSHAVVISGRYGAGKSHAAQVLAEDAARRDERVAWVRPWTKGVSSKLPIRTLQLARLDQIAAAFESGPVDLVVIDSFEAFPDGDQQPAEFAEAISRALGCRIVVTVLTRT